MTSSTKQAHEATSSQGQKLVDRAKLMATADSVRPFPLGTEVKVRFDLRESTFGDYITEFTSSVVNNVNPLTPLNEDEVHNDLFEYYSALVKIRIDYVNGKRGPFRPQDPDWVVSGFMSVMLEQIGKTIPPKDEGYVLVPEFVEFWKETKDGKKPVEAPSWAGLEGDELREWLRQKTKKIRKWFGMSGVQYTMELPRSKEGSPDFMVMQVVKGEIISRYASHSFWAMCAGVLGVHQNFTCALNAMSYGMFSGMKQCIVRAVDLEGGKPYASKY